MLKALRNKRTQKQIYIVIAVAVVATFAVSGVILNRDDHKSGSSLAVLNGHKITAGDYLNSYRAVERQFNWMFGDKFKAMLRFLNIKGEAWDRILLLDYAKKEHIKASDSEVVDWITTQKAFQSNGRFDDRIYKLYVRESFRDDARAFEEEVRQMLTISKIQQKLQSSITVKDEELKKLYSAAHQEKDIQYGILLMDEKNASLKTPEDAAKKLKELKPKLESGDFEAALKTASIDPKHADKVKRNSSPKELGAFDALSDNLASLKEGQVGEVLPIAGGAAIVKVVKIYPLDERQFAADKDKSRKEAVDVQARTKMESLLKDLRTKLQINLEVMKLLFPEEETKL